MGKQNGENDMSQKNNGFFRRVAKYYYLYVIIKKFREILKNRECKADKNQENSLSFKEKVRIIYIAVGIILIIARLLRSDKTGNNQPANQ